MSHVADMSLQAYVTPCTILHTIGDQKVDVGKARIMELKEPLFHSRPIPPNVFKVSVASVKPGHENLPPQLKMAETKTVDKSATTYFAAATIVATV